MTGRPFGASRLQLPPGPWATLLDGLCARFPAISRDTWRERLARGRVLDAQGAPLPPQHPYRVGQEIHYFREPESEPVVPFEARVLYRDAHLLVADKPHFLPVAPTGRYAEQTLLRRLQRALDLPGLVPLHRIDRDTAGLVLFSVRPDSRAAFQALFRDRRIDKRYEALAPPLPALAFPHRRESRLERGEPFFRMREADGPANACTDIDVIERGPGAWRYALRPVTGRKHQLRVHLAALGAPIVNDPLYPLVRPAGGDPFAAPLKLLARGLAFDDPVTGEPRRFESGLRL